MTEYNPTQENDSVESGEEDILVAEDGGEILTDGGRSVPEQKEVKPPVETKEKIEGVRALARADNHWENTLEVTGHATPPDEPYVSFSLGNRGQPHDSAVVVSLDPDRARELAETLKRKADYAEEWGEHRREEMETDADA